jgi:hypothetical protein
MKVHGKRMTTMRSAAIASCVAALAVPSLAGAMPLAGDPPSAAASTAVSVGPTIALNHENAASRVAALSGIGADTLSSQSKVTGTAPVPAPAPVVREVRTVTDSSDRTLAIVLASAALGIALCGTAYALARVAAMQRRVIGSSS